MIIQFFHVFKSYFIEVLPALGIGFFLSGLIHEFVPGDWIRRYLGKSGIVPILYSTLAGTLLPVCCFGALPIAVSLHKKGAKLGPVLAFLVATPATSITALLVTYSLLGIKFTGFIFFSVILLGIVIGIIGNFLNVKPKEVVLEESLAKDPICGMNIERATAITTEYNGKRYYFCSSGCKTTFIREPAKYYSERLQTFSNKLTSVLKYGFIDMLKEIGPELIIGLILAAVVATITPVGYFIKHWLAGGIGYLFALIFGLIMYICSTGSVPLVHAFISQGMNIGAGLVLLLVGPITSWGSILVLRKEFGGKILLIYLAVISVLSLGLGYCFSIL